MKKVFITGINGQDGSYLAEYLLDLGYEVHGTVRRNSVPENQSYRLSLCENNPNFHKHYADLLDQTSIEKLLTEIKPDEIYNLAAQSHVRISFDVPQFTVQTNAVGVINLLEAYKRICPDAKFYQASSSEMFGLTVDDDGFQRETTIMNPVSPYGCSKVFGYNIVKHYRRAYNLHACNGILFNHECLTSWMPMFYKINSDSLLDIKPICEIVEFDHNREEYQAKEVSNIQVWGKEGWVDVKYASAFPHDIEKDNKKPRFINSRSGAVVATSNHVGFFDGGEEKEFGEVVIGDKVETVDLPVSLGLSTLVSLEEAELLGLLVGDGTATKDFKTIQFINSSDKLRKRCDYLWKFCTGGVSLYYPSKSGYSDKIVGRLDLYKGGDWLSKFEIYNKDRKKRVPKEILNSSTDVMLAFLRGYNMADGLKANKCIYEFKNFKTNSPTLAMGLWYLIDQTTKQDINLTVEQKDDGSLYYSLNLLSASNKEYQDSLDEVKSFIEDGKESQRSINRITGISRKVIKEIQHGTYDYMRSGKGAHLTKNLTEVKKIIEMSNYDGWFYDLETSSGEFHCGVGLWHVHNSPRRGSNFVTNKVVKEACKIKLGLSNKLELGNMDAYRDWGHSKDYVKGMVKIINHTTPDDFVLSTMETHSVREMCDVVFKYLDLDYKDYVVQNPKFLRPEELPYLKGDSTKARTVLDWKPEYTFESLMHEMCDHWMDVLQNKPSTR